MKIKNLLKTNSKKDNKEKVIFKLPIKDIKDNLIIGENNTYKMIMKVSPVNGDLSTEDELKEISEAIQGALNSFEGRQGIYILSERIDVEKNLENMEKKKIELTDEFKIENLNEQITYFKSMTSKYKSVLNFYLVLEIKQKNINIAEQLFNDSYKSIKNELESKEMFCDRLNEHEAKTILYERLNEDQSQVEPYQEDWLLENIYPQSAIRHKDGRHITLENKIYRFFTITKYPATVDEYRWLKKLLSVPGDINIAITLTPKSKINVQSQLSKAANELGGKAKLSKDQLSKQKYEDEKESAVNMIREIGQDNVSLYDVNITIGVSGKDKEELETMCNLVRSKISSCYMQSTEIRRKDFDPVYTILPLLAENKITQNYVWNLTTKDVASIIPFDSSEFMESIGTLIGDNASGGIVVANYYNKIYNNAHMCILADSGSGKTFFIKTDAIRNIPYVDYTIMFDIKGDLWFPYGKRYTFSATSDVVVNPFHIRNAIIDSNSDMECDKVNVGIFLSQKIMDLIVFFKWIIPDLSPFDESLLEECIRKTYKKCNLDFNSTELPKEFCTMETLDKIMEEEINKTDTEMEKERLKYIKGCLRPYTKGAYSKIFNGQTNWDFDFFTVFDINNIPEAVKKPLYDILLKDTWQFCKKDGTVSPTRKNVYVDECHEFADPLNPQTLMFLSTKLSKQGRGFGIRLVTATQNLPDFLSIPRYGQAIIDNSYFKLFMKLGESDIPVAKKLYSFSENEIKILRGSGSRKKGTKGKGIFIIGAQRVLIQTKASKYELEVIDPEQFQEIYKQKSRFLNERH
ncbi:VirB4 family type IV secretion system protein [Clostridium botulinum]|uniref:VirB4 family type IV secretion system protein n=1 Tax=Clostridium botulinum TaxID=1491 RepID=UPI0007746DAC|nr:hypothetical protein [Clostridium botulinum]